MRTKLINGERINFTSEDEAARDAEEAAALDAAPLRQWQADMQALDAEGVTRVVEDLMDAMIGAGITIAPHLMEIHGRKKAKRNKKPT